MPLEIDPATLELILTLMQHRIDTAFEETFRVGKTFVANAYEYGWGRGAQDVNNAGTPFDVPPDLEALKILEGYQFDLLKGFSEDVKKEIGRVVRDAVSNGWSIPRATKELKEVLNKKKWRLNTIARTEVLRASNAGRLEAYKKSRVVSGKEWLTAEDDRTCPICSSLDGERRKLDDSFSIGVMAPPAHPNCRCTITPLLEGYHEGFNLEGRPAREAFAKKDELHVGRIENEYAKALNTAYSQAMKDCVTILKKGGFA